MVGLSRIAQSRWFGGVYVHSSSQSGEEGQFQRYAELQLSRHWLWRPRGRCLNVSEGTPGSTPAHCGSGRHRNRNSSGSLAGSNASPIMNDKMPSDVFPSIPKYVALREIVGEARYIVNARTGDYYELDPVQMDILLKAQGNLSASAIALDAGLPQNDVAEFFSNLCKDGLIRLDSEPSQAAPPHFRQSAPPHLSDVLVEVTGRCNLRCSHCFNSDFNTERAVAREMTTASLLRLISSFDDLNVRRLQISGGEALLRRDLWDVIDAIDEHRIFLDVISTNASLIDDYSANRFGERFRENGALYISMDGINATSYETLRGSGTFPRFMRSMDMLFDQGCRVFINTMAVRSNINEMHEMYDWMAAHPCVKGWRIGLPKVLGRYLEFHEALEVDFGEVILVFKTLLQRWLNDRPSFRLELSDFFRTDSLDSGLEDHRNHDNPCKYALTNLSIKPDGTAVFCASLEIHAPAVLGNVVQDGLAGVWYGERHRRFRQMSIADLPACANCRYVRICGAGCRSNALLSFDDIHAQDPRACEAMQMLEKEILPILPTDYGEQLNQLICNDRSFVPPPSYKRFI
jgi:radical SAM protein with 4Fe4S-binding SPASM domain